MNPKYTDLDERLLDWYSSIAAGLKNGDTSPLVIARAADAIDRLVFDVRRYAHLSEELGDHVINLASELLKAAVK